MVLFNRGGDDTEPPSRPLPNTYWVIPHRVLAGEYPGGTDDANGRIRIALLSGAGVDTFFDLTEEGELPPYRHLLPARSEYLRSGIADTWVPHNVSQTKELLATMRSALARRRTIYVHCRAGIGRTGLVVGCFLADQQSDGKAALKQLNELWRQSERARDWPRIPQTAEQADYIQRWPQLVKSAARAEAASPGGSAARPEPAPKVSPAHAKKARSMMPGRSAGTRDDDAPARDGSLFRSVGRANAVGPAARDAKSSRDRDPKKRR